MDYREISRIMINDVGYSSKGKTPEATLNSEIGRDNRFLKYRGMVELKEWQSSLEDAINNFEKYQCLNCGKEIKK